MAMTTVTISPRRIARLSPRSEPRSPVQSEARCGARFVVAAPRSWPVPGLIIAICSGVMTAGEKSGGVPMGEAFSQAASGRMHRKRGQRGGGLLDMGTPVLADPRHDIAARGEVHDADHVTRSGAV